ncbi:hypothetical protein H8D59_02805 [bacterium]|nr:hypothetical protein [bacterium]
MKDNCQPSDCPCPMMQKVNLEDVNSDEFVVSAKVKITDNLAMNTVFVPLAENHLHFSSQSFQISKTEKPLVIPLRI